MERIDVRDPHALIHLVNGRVDDPDLDHLGAHRGDESTVRGTAAGGELGSHLQLLLHGAGGGLRQVARNGQEGISGNEPFERVLDPMPPQQFLHHGLQAVDGLLRRITQIETSLQSPRDPCTVSRPLKLPRRPILMVSPSVFSLDGSPTRHQSMRSPRSRSTSTTRRVPSTDGPSSSLVINRAIVPRCSGCRRTNCSQAVSMAARPLFMSAAPRPYNKPSLMTGLKGSLCHSSSGPEGTTSVWPAKQNTGPPLPRFAQKLSTGPKRIRSTANPMASSRSIINSWQPPSAGLTEARAISSSVNCRVSDFGGGVIRSAAPELGGADSPTGRRCREQARR